MYIVAFIFIFLLGTLIGSFLNVVIYRWNTGKSISRGRSICMTCNRTLRWYELIPIFSYLIQSGRCRRCASQISHQYPLVELTTGILFALLSLHFLPLLGNSQLLYVSVLSLFMFTFSLLIMIAVYDMRHKVIPDAFVYTYALFSFILLFINQSGTGAFFIRPSLLDLFAGPLFALPFALIWLLSSGRLMGLGDAKLILGVGWMLGFVQGLSALVMSFWIGSIVSIGILLVNKGKMNIKSEIPFAPFLVIGVLIVFFFNIDVFPLSSLLNL